MTAEPARNGWTFLSDFDARAASSGNIRSNGTSFVVRPESATQPEGTPALSESLSELFALKRKLMPLLDNVPLVEEEKPVVCAWHPTARAVLLWNLAERHETFTIKFKETRRPVAVDGLDIKLVKEIG